MLVELACGTALAAAYSPSLFRRLIGETGQPTVVVFVVCGGFKVSLNDMMEFSVIVDRELKGGGNWMADIDGDRFSFSR